MSINTKAFALTCGIFWGVSVFLLTWWVMMVGSTYGDATLIERVYIGYTFTPGGSLIGFCWGFGDGLVAGAIFAWLFNLIQSSPRVKTG